MHTASTQTPSGAGPDFDSLRHRLSGPLYEPIDPHYAELATPWNMAVFTFPAAEVEACNPQDVVESVKFAAANGLPVTAQATGHGVASDMAGALLIHTRALDECTINTDTQTASTGAGVTWKTVLSECEGLGLAGLCGSAPGVSVAGYTSGGGIGPMARTYGAASDRVRSINVVTGDGALHHATATDEPELFWGLRGGKGSLGIITGMEFELLPLPMIYAGALFFDTHHVSDILHAWTEWRSTLTAAATTSVALMQMPPLPGVPEPIAGKFTIAVRYVFAGKPDDGARWLAPLRSVAPMLKDAVGPMPSSMIGLVHSDPEDALPATEGSALLATFDAAAAQTLLNVAGPDSDSPQLMVEIRQFGGLLSQEPEIPSALCHRDAEFGLSTVAAAPPPDLPALATHAAGEREHMSPWAHGGTLPNFASSEGQAGFATSYTAPVLERLSGLAEHFDFSHVFRMGQVPMR